MQLQAYVPESYTTYEKIQENVWIPTIHETFDEMCKEVKEHKGRNRKTSSYQQEGLYKTTLTRKKCCFWATTAFRRSPWTALVIYILTVRKKERSTCQWYC